VFRTRSNVQTFPSRWRNRRSRAARLASPRITRREISEWIGYFWKDEFVISSLPDRSSPISSHRRPDKQLMFGTNIRRRGAILPRLFRNRTSWSCNTTKNHHKVPRAKRLPRLPGRGDGQGPLKTQGGTARTFDPSCLHFTYRIRDSSSSNRI
jgi:hypothetical protein